MGHDHADSHEAHFKIRGANSDNYLYTNGNKIALGPEISGNEGFHWKVNPNNNGVQNVDSHLYISEDGKLGTTPQAWHVEEIPGHAGHYRFKIPGTNKHVGSGTGDVDLHQPENPDHSHAWKIEYAD